MKSITIPFTKPWLAQDCRIYLAKALWMQDAENPRDAFKRIWFEQRCITIDLVKLMYTAPGYSKSEAVEIAIRFLEMCWCKFEAQEYNIADLHYYISVEIWMRAQIITDLNIIYWMVWTRWENYFLYIDEEMAKIIHQGIRKKPDEDKSDWPLEGSDNWEPRLWRMVVFRTQAKNVWYWKIVWILTDETLTTSLKVLTRVSYTVKMSNWTMCTKVARVFQDTRTMMRCLFEIPEDLI